MPAESLVSLLAESLASISRQSFVWILARLSRSDPTVATACG